MQCPVCSNSAKVTAPDHDGLSVECEGCGAYDIAAGYESKLIELDPAARADVLRKAQHLSVPGERPCISGPCF